MPHFSGGESLSRSSEHRVPPRLVSIFPPDDDHHIFGGRVQFISRCVTADEGVLVLDHAALLVELGLVPDHPGGGGGNLSFRRGRGLIITGGGVYLGRVELAQLVEVAGCDPAKNEVCARGVLEPSSETLLHWAVYCARPEVRAVFHGHDAAVLAAAGKLGLPITAVEQPYGSPALVEEVLKVLDGHYYLLLRNHGFLALGRTLAQTGRLAASMCESAKACEEE